VSGWREQYEELKAGGVPEELILNEAASYRQELVDGGVPDELIEKEMGTYVNEEGLKNLTKTFTPPPLAEGETRPEEADSLFDYLEAGFQGSSSVMAVKALKGERVTPNMLVPEQAGMFMRAASTVGTIAGDLPAMAAGGMIGAPVGATAGALTGAAIGSVVPGVGTLIGAGVGGIVGGIGGIGAGMNAAPEAIRSTLMEYYEKGELQNFGDFWERFSSVFVKTRNSGIVGGAGALAGAGVLSKFGGTTLGAKVAAPASELATMVTVGSALEGEMPDAQAFLDGSILLTGLGIAGKVPKVAKKTAAKLRNGFAKKGLNPAEVAQEAMADPVLKQQLINEDIDAPLIGGPVKKTEPVKPPKSELLTSDDRILDRVKSTESKLIDKINDGKEALRPEHLYFETIEKEAPIARFEKDIGFDPDNTMAPDSGYKMARILDDYKNKVKFAFKEYTVDVKTGEKNGEALEPILKELSKTERREFDALRIAKQAKEMEAAGLEHGWDIKDIDETIAKYGTKYDEKIARYQSWKLRAGLEPLRDAGVIDQAQIDRMTTKWPSHMAFKRVIEEDGKAAKKKSKAKNVLKKRKGSQEAIQDPLLSDIENIDAMQRAAAINIARSTFFQNVEKAIAKGETPESLGVRKVEHPVNEQAAMEKAARVLGKDVKDVTSADVDALTHFSEKPLRELTDHQVEYWNKGKREVWEFEDVDLAKSLRMIGDSGPQMGMGWRLLRNLQAMKRFGITTDPGFLWTTSARDQIQASVMSKEHVLPFYDTFAALLDMKRGTQEYKDFQLAGGANAAFLNLDQNYLNQFIYELDAKVGFMKKSWGYVSRPIHHFEAFSRALDNAPRFAIYKKVTRAGAPKQEGGYRSREGTVDFQRRGANQSLAKLHAVTAFQKVSIQSLDREMRSLTGKDRKSVYIKGGLLISAPTLYLWYANQGDERIKERPQWEKDVFWHVGWDDWEEVSDEDAARQPKRHLVRQNEKTGKWEQNNGVVLKYPKPPLFGFLFGTMFERMLDKHVADNPDAFSRIEETLERILVPPILPDGVAPVVEQYANKSFFTGGNIVSESVLDLLPQDQFTEYTSETAKKLSNFILAAPLINRLGKADFIGGQAMASPMIIDNYIYQWSGSVGRTAVSISDAALRNLGLAKDKQKVPKDWAESYFVKAFLARSPKTDANSIELFKKKFERNNKLVETYQARLQRGDTEGAQSIYEENKHLMIAPVRTYQALIQQQKAITNIDSNPEIPVDDKRQLMDSLYYGMIETAKAGVEAMNQYEKSMKEGQ